MTVFCTDPECCDHDADVVVVMRDGLPRSICRECGLEWDTLPDEPEVPEVSEVSEIPHQYGAPL